MKKINTIILIILLIIFCAGCSETSMDVNSEEVSISVETNLDADRIEATSVVELNNGAEEILKENSVENHEIEETEIKECKEVTLVMVGDMLMHTPVNATGVMEDGSIDFSHLFIYTKEWIEEADIAIVNQEVILGGEELGISGYPAFNTYYELGDALAETGFDVVLHATNHALDKGKKGINNCLSYWENNHPEIAVLGIQDSWEEQEEIYVHEENGIRIAILNYTYGTNGIPLPEDMPYAVNLMDKEQMAEDIEKAKQISDFIVVCPHWGTEYILIESEYQKEYTDFFLECGVDLVLGTHPHVIEPVKMMEGEDGHEMLVYYSLGNYVNCTSSETEEIGRRMLGAMAEVTISMNAEGDAYISEYGALPLVTYVSDTQEEIVVYPLEQFTDEMALNSYTIRFDTDFSKTYCEQLWENVMGDMK